MTAPDPTLPTDAPRPPSPASDRGVSPIAGRLGARQGKVITLAAAIKNIPDALNHTYTCSGSFPVGDIVITDAGMAAHGEITLDRALTVSCNIAFAQAALESDHCRIGSLETRVLKSAGIISRSLPHRQLRNGNKQIMIIITGSLPHRQLRK